MRARLNILPVTLFFLALALISPVLPASGPPPPDPTSDPAMIAAGFLDGHPDLRYRLQGLDEYGKENHEEAFRLFKRAGFYSDKPSQAIVGEMLWIGLGTEQDQALAYVWMDLAAERGYANFSDKRDRYWNELDEAQRRRAETEGPEIRAEYGDAVAGKRLEVVLRRVRRQMTGSRTGFGGNLVQIVIPGYGSIDSTKFYDPRYWDPAQYRAWHDSMWMDLQMGQVDVGEIEQVGNEESPEPTRSEEPH